MTDQVRTGPALIMTQHSILARNRVGTREFVTATVHTGTGAARYQTLVYESAGAPMVVGQYTNPDMALRSHRWIVTHEQQHLAQQHESQL